MTASRDSVATLEDGHESPLARALVLMTASRDSVATSGQVASVSNGGRSVTPTGTTVFFSSSSVIASFIAS
jgi:hypothetical protein